MAQAQLLPIQCPWQTGLIDHRTLPFSVPMRLQSLCKPILPAATTYQSWLRSGILLANTEFDDGPRPCKFTLPFPLCFSALDLSPAQMDR